MIKLSTETARRMDVTQVSSNNIKLIMIKLSTETARRMDVTQVSSLRSRHSGLVTPSRPCLSAPLLHVYRRAPTTHTSTGHAYVHACIQEGADDTYLDRDMHTYMHAYRRAPTTHTSTGTYIRTLAHAYILTHLLTDSTGRGRLRQVPRPGRVVCRAARAGEEEGA